MQPIKRHLSIVCSQLLSFIVFCCQFDNIVTMINTLALLLVIELFSTLRSRLRPILRPRPNLRLSLRSRLSLRPKPRLRLISRLTQNLKQKPKFHKFLDLMTFKILLFVNRCFNYSKLLLIHPLLG